MPNSGADAHPRLVLDTSAYSHFRHGHGPVLDLVAAAEMIMLPVTVLGELEAAFELGSRAKENRAALRQFFDEPFVRPLPITPAVARRYGLAFAQLRRAGTPIPVNDIWIAATTLECGGHLVTFDADFRRVEGLDYTVLKS